MSRAAVVTAVSQFMPGLERLVRCAYGARSWLIYAGKTIDSSSGVQQGDPLGPLLFALAIRGISHGGFTGLSVWYLDDGTLGGEANLVATEIQRIKLEASRVGLSLNEVKCEAVSAYPEFIESARVVLPDCAAVEIDDCVLLGAAVGKRAVSAQLAKRERNLRALSARFAEIDRHDSLALLRVSLGHPRAVYELRAGAGFRDGGALAAYDAALKEVVGGALNIALDKRSWGQCVLPPVLGGLGIRAPSDLALPAFLSSAAASDTLAGSVALGAPDGLAVEAKAEWAQAAGVAQPEGPVIFQVLAASVRPGAPRSFAGGTAQSEGRRASARVINSRVRRIIRSPAKQPGRHTTHGHRVANCRGVASRLRGCRPRVCACGDLLDGLGDHALVCNHGAERLRRHADLNSRIRDAFAEAGFQAVLEPPGLAAQNGRRPDGVTVAAFERGRPLAWDVTVVHTCASSHLPSSSVAARAAANSSDVAKERKYADLDGRIDLRPFGIETLGSFGTRALELVEALVAVGSDRAGHAAARLRLYRRLGAAVQAGNAKRIIEAHSGAPWSLARGGSR